jgi:predicted RND superfamily exporter protein
MIIIVFLLMTGFFAMEIGQLTIDPALDDFLPEEHPEVVFFDEIRQIFSLFEVIIVGVVDDREEGVFQPDTLRLIKDLSVAVEDISGVRKIVSLYEFPYIEGDTEGMRVFPLFSEVNEEQTWLSSMRDRVFRWPLLVGGLVSEDGRATAILVQYKKGSTEQLRREVYHRVMKTVEAVDTPHQEIFVAGMASIEACITDYIVRDVKRLLPAVFALVILCLWLSFRSFLGVLLPLLTVVVSLLWTMGVMALVRVPLTTLTSALPVLLTAVGTAYTIHILFHFLHNASQTTDRREALVQCVSQVGYAVIMAGLTTCGGFASLGITQVIPIRYFGVFAAVGTFVSLLCSLTLIPAILNLGINRIILPEASAEPSGSGGLERRLRSYVRYVISRRRALYATSLLLAALFLAGTLRIYVENDYITQFKRSSYIRQSDQMINEHFSGSMVMNIIVMGEEPDFLKEPETLRRIESLQNFVETLPNVGGTTSLVDYLKRMNQALNADDPAFNRIPDTRELVAQLLLLYSMSGDESDLDDVINDDYSLGCITVALRSGSTRHAAQIVQQIEAYNQETTRLPIHMTAAAVLGKVVDDLTLRGQKQSMTASIVVVLCLVTLILRSFVGGLFAILPLLLCLLCNFGIMGWASVPLQTGTAIIASVALGIGIDYAIHFLNIARIKAREGMGIEEALEEAGGTAGRAIVYNAAAVGLGFFVLVFSSFLWNIYFGAFITLTMLTASLATLTLLPCLVSSFRPAFLQRKKKERAE